MNFEVSGLTDNIESVHLVILLLSAIQADMVYRKFNSAGDLCLQLTIQEGGVNFADGLRNYIVKDPGGLALAPEPETVTDSSAEQASGRAGTLSLWLLLMLSITVTISWRLRLEQRINVRTLTRSRYGSSQK